MWRRYFPNIKVYIFDLSNLTRVVLLLVTPLISFYTCRHRIPLVLMSRSWRHFVLSLWTIAVNYPLSVSAELSAENFCGMVFSSLRKREKQNFMLIWNFFCFPRKSRNFSYNSTPLNSYRIDENAFTLIIFTVSFFEEKSFSMCSKYYEIFITAS